jgi:hypothetical protein
VADATRVSLKKTNLMAQAFLLGQIINVTRVVGKMVLNMVKANKLGLMEQATRGGIKMAFDMEEAL